jgi:hypothetical protein
MRLWPSRAGARYGRAGQVGDVSQRREYCERTCPRRGAGRPGRPAMETDEGRHKGRDNGLAGGARRNPAQATARSDSSCPQVGSPLQRSQAKAGTDICTGGHEGAEFMGRPRGGSRQRMQCSTWHTGPARITVHSRVGRHRGGRRCRVRLGGVRTLGDRTRSAHAGARARETRPRSKQQGKDAFRVKGRGDCMRIAGCYECSWNRSGQGGLSDARP